MIQRKQTLYLLAAVVLLVLTMVLPLGKYLANDTELVLTAFSISEKGGVKVVGNLPWEILTALGTLTLLSALVPFVTIFLYKRRFLQIRLCFAEFVLLAGLQGFIAWYLLHARNSLSAFGDISTVYCLPAIFPLVSIVFVWLALRGITKDEALIRSMDRIR